MLDVATDGDGAAEEGWEVGGEGSGFVGGTAGLGGSGFDEEKLTGGTSNGFDSSSASFAGAGFAGAGFAVIGFAGAGFAAIGFAAIGFAGAGFAVIGFAGAGFATAGLGAVFFLAGAERGKEAVVRSFARQRQAATRHHSTPRATTTPTAIASHRKNALPLLSSLNRTATPAGVSVSTAYRRPPKRASYWRGAKPVKPPITPL